jgi:hypothetical protein
VRERRNPGVNPAHLVFLIQSPPPRIRWSICPNTEEQVVRYEGLY